MASKKVRENKFPPLPAIELTPEQKRMFQQNDFIGLESNHIAFLRQLDRRTPEQEQEIEAHEREEILIKDHPREVLREAHQAIDRGTTLLLKLIRSHGLRYDIPNNHGDENFSHDSAFDCLSSRIDYLNKQLIRLAEEKIPRAGASLWFQAKTLSEATMRLALIDPIQFRPVAETSLTMPSVRARNPKFTADAATIAKLIHLGEKHPATDITDNRSRAGAYSHYLVARILDEVHWHKRHYEFEVKSLKRLQTFHETAEKYEGVTIEQLIRSSMHPYHAERLLRCASLPDWPNGPNTWWEQGMLPIIRDEFDMLSNDSTRNPGLWEELLQGGERNTTKDARRYLEKLCHNKFLQLLKNCP